MAHDSVKKVILAYSGGLDTSVMLHWMKDTYNCEVVGYCADVGQKDELTGLDEKAKKTGASKMYIEDLREEFVRDYVFFAIQANAKYEDLYLMGTSLARPLIAKRHIEIAIAEGADAVAHGATGKGNDQVRFELTYYALKPDIKVIAPWRHWEFSSRSDLLDYCKNNNLPVVASHQKPYSMDRNVMHISFEGGVLEDPWNEPPDDLYVLVNPLEKTPDQAQYLEIDFEKGVPVAVDGKAMGPFELLDHLNDVAGEHGVGRIDIVENRFVGMKSRGVYETPGATVLMSAHRALESITMDREVMRLRDSLNTRISEMIYYGFWFSPEFDVIRAMVTESQKHVTGTTRVKLYKGNCIVVGRKSPFSLYSEEFATFEKDSVYDQRDAEGFIKLNSLRLRLNSMMQQK
ncbi:MAG: argininosuccinate synthase [Deltaproteobacteria bacterium]|nr:MAG: argininosuccinate synthase [Deltaproteobacteria bacterium]